VPITLLLIQSSITKQWTVQLAQRMHQHLYC